MILFLGNFKLYGEDKTENRFFRHRKLSSKHRSDGHNSVWMTGKLRIFNLRLSNYQIVWLLSVVEKSDYFHEKRLEELRWRCAQWKWRCSLGVVRKSALFVIELWLCAVRFMCEMNMDLNRSNYKVTTELAHQLRSSNNNAIDGVSIWFISCVCSEIIV